MTSVNVAAVTVSQAAQPAIPASTPTMLSSRPKLSALAAFAMPLPGWVLVWAQGTAA